MKTFALTVSLAVKLAIFGCQLLGLGCSDVPAFDVQADPFAALTPAEATAADATPTAHDAPPPPAAGDAASQRPAPAVSFELPDLFAKHEPELDGDDPQPTPDIDVPPVQRRVEVWIFTDASWCVPCKRLEPTLNSALWNLLANQWRVTFRQDYHVPCDVRVWNVVRDHSPPPVLKRLRESWSLPLVVAVQTRNLPGAPDVRILREWNRTSKLDAHAIGRLLYGESRPDELVDLTAVEQTTWTVATLRAFIADYAKRPDRQTATVKGQTVRDHLVKPIEFGHHGWKSSLVDALTEAEQHVLHGADHGEDAHPAGPNYRPQTVAGSGQRN